MCLLLNRKREINWAAYVSNAKKRNNQRPKTTQSNRVCPNLSESKRCHYVLRFHPCPCASPENTRRIHIEMNLFCCPNWRLFYFRTAWRKCCAIRAWSWAEKNAAKKIIMQIKKTIQFRFCLACFFACFSFSIPLMNLCRTLNCFQWFDRNNISIEWQRKIIINRNRLRMRRWNRLRMRCQSAANCIEQRWLNRKFTSHILYASWLFFSTIW